MTRRQPGQRGRAQSTIALLEQLKDIIEPLQPISVRGVCYRAFVAGLIPSMETKYTSKVSRILTWARKENQIPWSWIVEETRDLERPAQWSNAQECVETIGRSYHRDYWLTQKNQVIVMSEKSTIKGIIKPVLDALGVGFLSAHGFDSTTNVHNLAHICRSNNGQQTVFLYIGDYDPSGLCMSETDLPKRLKEHGATHFKLQRIALTAQDTKTLGHDLAYDITVKRDTRLQWYVDCYGTEGWELDAMRPDILRQRIQDEITPFIDWEAWERTKRLEEAEQECFLRISGRMLKALGKAGEAF